MIVEIFGPPAAGKTTLAHALAEGLRARGVRTDLALSHRPSEPAKDGRLHNPQAPALIRVARRLGRPAIEMVATARHLLDGSAEGNTTCSLLALMPPVNPVWALRLRQYIWRLTHAWNDARTADRIVIFDQGFVQAVCSLALLCAPEHAGRLALACDLIPRADMLIWLDAPPDVLRARLLKRERKQGVLERMLEFDLGTNLRSVAVIERLEALLEERNAAMTCVRSEDELSREAALRRLQRAATERAGLIGASA